MGYRNGDRPRRNGPEFAEGQVTIPERVLTTGEFNRLLGFYRSGRGGEYDAAADTLNVHDAALRERLREVEAEREKFREQVSKLVDDINGFYPRNQAILEESRALRAEREALQSDLKAAQELEQLHLKNLDAAYADLAALVPLIERCGELFSAIRGDWSDPRAECREGFAIVAAARAVLDKENV